MDSFDRDEVILQHIIEIKEDIAAMRANQTNERGAVDDLKEDVQKLNKKVNFAHGILATVMFIVTIVAAIGKLFFK